MEWEEIQSGVIRLHSRVIEDMSVYLREEQTRIWGSLRQQHSDQDARIVEILSRMDRMELSREELRGQIEGQLERIKRGVDDNIERVSTTYGEKSKDFYVYFRNHILGMYKYLHVFATGNLEVPIGRMGDRIDNVEHFMELGLSIIDSLPIPFIDLIHITLGEGIFRISEAAREMVRSQVSEKFALMLRQLQSVEVRGEWAVENFCKAISSRIVERYHGTINDISEDKLEVIAHGLVRYVLEESVGGRGELDELVASHPHYQNRWQKFKGWFKLLRRSADAEPISDGMVDSEDDEAVELSESSLPTMFMDSARDISKLLQLPEVAPDTVDT